MNVRAASLLAVAAVGSVVAAGAIHSQGAKAPVVWTAGDIKWMDNAAIPGAKIAVLWGDPKTGAYGAFKTIPDGAALAMHTHTQDQKVIGIAGTITLVVEGSPAKALGAGSFAMIPGGTKHTAACKGSTTGAACQYFEEQPGASDLKYVAGAKH
jgi:quercetin dioxygenase-like cupin family protein